MGDLEIVVIMRVVQLLAVTMLNTGVSEDIVRKGKI
jgi:hypothetical protein